MRNRSSAEINITKSDNESKAVWDVISDSSGKKRSNRKVISEFSISRHFLNQPSKIAESFNEFFTSSSHLQLVLRVIHIPFRFVNTEQASFFAQQHVLKLCVLQLN
ncbi:hypothetical protein J6590_026215 [Homalodisca vitripennis]|nr:hypothetical protein J6590_026215 [Homalodisca vitripennis]